MTFINIFIIDKFGRRVLLIYGLSSMTLCLFLLAYGLNAKWNENLLLFLLISYIASYAASIGCIFWLIIAEISPLEARGKIMSISAAANWATNLVVSMTALTLVEFCGISHTFAIYAFFGLLSIIYCYRYIPETNRLSLEKIEKALSGN